MMPAPAMTSRSEQRPANPVGEPVLRHATWLDSEILLAWRNDPATRANFGNTEAITRNKHEAWLRRKLADPNSKLMIAEVGERPVGTVRAELQRDGWWLSWSVDRRARGHGYGRSMVAAMITLLEGPVRAMIKADNIASERIALANGMTIYKQEGDFVYWQAADGDPKTSSDDGS